MPDAALEVRTYGAEARPRVGFFTDTSLCIGCKACEVACKEWNRVPDDIAPWTGDSYDNTRALGADTWRHVAFIEQRVPGRRGRRGPVARPDRRRRAPGRRRRPRRPTRSATACAG